MGVRRCAVSILLVDHDGVRIALDAMGDIADTSGFLPRGFGKLAQNLGNILAIFGRELHSDRKADHGEQHPPLLLYGTAFHLAGPPENSLSVSGERERAHRPLLK